MGTKKVNINSIPRIPNDGSINSMPIHSINKTHAKFWTAHFKGITFKIRFHEKKKKNIFKTKKNFVVNSISTKQKRKGGEFSKPLAFGVNCSKFEAISRKILNCTFLWFYRALCLSEQYDDVLFEFAFWIMYKFVSNIRSFHRGGNSTLHFHLLRF